ncbi:MAG: UDP-3-O-acyl-N-acetylglucosamine deacetylase [Rickettsiales bacterium]|nr:UDP-3-O-acyl-N-acetylglucosamine deacetylase [Rickettsiales bacterium]
MFISSQKTINSKISCTGVGLHSGHDATITLIPAPQDNGIVFRRTDVAPEKSLIKANYKNVVTTNLGTTLANEFGTKVSTIEHLMAAIWGCGIDNLFIDIDGAEVPIMDGSSEPFVFLIECAGINIQEKTRHIIEVLKTVKVEEDDGKSIEVKPAIDFSITLHIDFDHKHIKKQSFDYKTTFASFKNDLCRARTFGFKHEIEQLYKMGLAKGGSMKNAILIGEDGIVNEEGWRYEDELVRHKTLDFIGDIYLAGYYIAGQFTGVKTGHTINNKILHELFKDQSAWRLI